MKITLVLIVFIFTFTLANAENSVGRKKGSHGSHGLHGIIYKSGLMSFVTFLAIKAKIIIAITVAFTVFILGAKVWATFKYGNLLFDKGCHSYPHGHDEIILPHPPTGYGPHGHEFVAPSTHEYEGLTPGYGYEKYGVGR